MNSSVKQLSKPSRPYTEYNIFYQLEREFILQKQLGVFPHFGPHEIFSCSNQNYEGPELPSRYNDIILPADWFVPGKKVHRRKRSHRKTHGKISFVALSKRVSASWKTVDDETRIFCARVSDIGMQNYKKEMAEFKNQSKKKIIQQPELFQSNQCYPPGVALVPNHSKISEGQQTFSAPRVFDGSILSDFQHNSLGTIGYCAQDAAAASALCNKLGCVRDTQYLASNDGIRGDSELTWNSQTETNQSNYQQRLGESGYNSYSWKSANLPSADTTCNAVREQHEGILSQTRNNPTAQQESNDCVDISDEEILDIWYHREKK